MKKLKAYILAIVVCGLVGFIVIPLVFFAFFHGEGHSEFAWMKSDISVENWFSFWITLIAALSSVFVGICSLRLTAQIEHVHKANTHNAERLLFIPTHVIKLPWTPKTKCQIQIFFPEGATLLNDKKIDSVCCKYNGKDLAFNAQLDSSYHPLRLCLSYTGNNNDSDELLDDWLSKEDSIKYDCLHVSLTISYKDVNFATNDDIKLAVEFDLYNKINDYRLDVVHPSVNFLHKGAKY